MGIIIASSIIIHIDMIGLPSGINIFSNTTIIINIVNSFIINILIIRVISIICVISINRVIVVLVLFFVVSFVSDLL